MAVIANSRPARNSKSARNSIVCTLCAAISVAAISCAALYFFYHRGYLLYYGDAECHLDIARRIIDSRTPGYEQLGTVWLPLPHLLMLPLVARDDLWRSGLAGAIPAAGCFVLAAAFLFAAVRRVFQSLAPAIAAAALFALNPNLLYLQSTPMTEAVFFATLMGLLYFTVRFQQKQSLWAVMGAGLAGLAGTLTRYEGWFVLPFAALFLLMTARRRRIVPALVFSILVVIGPLWFGFYNWWIYGNAFEFYSGPYSAQAIQGGLSYPGNGDWKTASLYFRTAVQSCVGAPLYWLGVAGIVAALKKRAWWPMALLILPSIFYVWSMHSSGASPIFLPSLPPYSYYNARYGMAALPLACFAAAALVSFARGRWMGAAAAIVVLAGIAPWLAHPSPENWITWKESQVNSEARRQWTAEAAAYLKTRHRPGEGIFTCFGDYTGIYRQAGIHLRTTLTGDNEPHWQAAVLRPDLFLWEEWAVTMGGDQAQTAINRARRRGPYYALVKRIAVKGAPVIEIYRHISAPEPE